MTVFSRLEPRLQAAIVSRLGWSSLRPVQELAGPAVLDGNNAIILAPTAGGKTEASMFPVLSMLMGRSTPGVGALYVAPIKALLNNQAERLGLYTEMVGLRRFVWHGDVTSGERRPFLADPTDLLMTTPESLEVMLVSQTVDPKALLGGVEVVVIDEVHAMAGTDRGAHLMSVIERIAALGGRDVQRIGLSATVGNPVALLGWLQGSSKRTGVVIDPPKVPSKRELLVVHRPDLGALAEDAAGTARGKKTLFFCQSRKTSEAVADAMRACGTEVFVHHGSVSKNERALAEERFHRGKDACIVCTSTLELGIDVGDLDRVLQAESPDSVSSFLQRMGRTGRRAGVPANTTFFCVEPDSVVQACALIGLAKGGWVESVTVNRRSWPVLVHQLLAMSLASGGITAEGAWTHFSKVPDFGDIHRAEFDRLLAWLLKDGALRVASGLLTVGPKAEKQFGRRNFMELYAVFSSPQSYTVQHGEQPIGTLGQAFVDRLVEGISTFLLAGRGWQVDHIRHGERVIRASPAPRGKEPTWGGITPSFLGFEVCQEIRAVLASEEVPAFLHPTAAEVLRERREALGEVAASPDGVEEADDGSIRWWTFAGGRINTTLKHALAAVGGDWKVTTDNLGLTVRGATRGELKEVRRRLGEIEFWEDEKLWSEVAGSLPGYRLSKFQTLMPKWVEQEMLAAFLLDIEGTWRWLSGGSMLARRPLRPQPVEDELVEVEVAEPLVMPANVEWVASTEALEAAAGVWRRAPAIGFDVETTLGSRMLCLAQVSDGERTWLVDPFEVDLRALGEVLEASLPVKIIHHASFERSVMAKHGIQIESVFDTLAESQRRTPEAEGGHSLRAVCARELGLDIDKAEQTSDWARRPLSGEQVRYAALDALVLVGLWSRWAAMCPS